MDILVLESCGVQHELVSLQQIVRLYAHWYFNCRHVARGLQAADSQMRKLLTPFLPWRLEVLVPDTRRNAAMVRRDTRWQTW